MANHFSNLVKIESYLKDVDIAMTATSKVILSKPQLKTINTVLMNLCLRLFNQKPLTAKFVIYDFWNGLGEQVKLSPSTKALAQASLRQFLKLLKESRVEKEHRSEEHHRDPR